MAVARLDFLWLIADIPVSKTADDRRTRIMKMVRFISHVRVPNGGFGSIFDAREV
jgi:hypothetical protein